MLRLALVTTVTAAWSAAAESAAWYDDYYAVRIPVEVTADGCIEPPQEVGIGYVPDLAWIEQITRRCQVFAH